MRSYGFEDAVSLSDFDHANLGIISARFLRADLCAFGHVGGIAVEAAEAGVGHDGRCLLGCRWGVSLRLKITRIELWSLVIISYKSRNSEGNQKLHISYFLNTGMEI